MWEVVCEQRRQNAFVVPIVYSLTWGYLKYIGRARSCKPFKEPRNRFPAWWASRTILFVVPACQATQAGGIDSSESIPGLPKGFQIRALITASDLTYSSSAVRHGISIRYIQDILAMASTQLANIAAHRCDSIHLSNNTTQKLVTFNHVKMDLAWEA
jgi:hypothetical protein